MANVKPSVDEVSMEEKDVNPEHVVASETLKTLEEAKITANDGESQGIDYIKGWRLHVISAAFVAHPLEISSLLLTIVIL